MNCLNEQKLILDIAKQSSFALCAVNFLNIRTPKKIV